MEVKVSSARVGRRTRGTKSVSKNKVISKSVDLSVIVEEKPDFYKMTIPQIKKWAKENGIKPPTLRKADLISFIEGVLWERENLPPKVNKVSAEVIFTPKWVDLSSYEVSNEKGASVESWLLHLKEKGWTVVPVDNLDPREYVDGMLNFFESCCRRFKKDDVSTWTSENMPILLHGILKHHCAHNPWQWKARSLCHPVFSKIWNDDDLLCSFDGVCFMPPKIQDGERVTPSKTRTKSWFHNDQGRSQEFVSVQGVLNLLPNGPEDGGLLVIEKSHLHFSEYIGRHPSEGFGYSRVDLSDPAYKDLEIVKVCANPGDLILFDSRTIHCNTQAQGTVPRMALYISMQPRCKATKKELEKRVKLFEQGRQTGHWCFGPLFSATAKDGRTYGRDPLFPSKDVVPKLDGLQRRMVGYDE
jgi:hypothetical protein